MKKHLTALLDRRPELAVCAAKIQAVNTTLSACFRRGGRVYLCGNGGSAADCEHWAGELLKGFYSKRPALEAEFFPASKQRLAFEGACLQAIL